MDKSPVDRFVFLGKVFHELFEKDGFVLTVFLGSADDATEIVGTALRLCADDG